ncbi:MAG: hypothetical protein M0C28_22935 [Candidatus Moduliflexus flocculans]|nr:hypothetical protein [Candidatus Moduliflexus flocculans]
MYEISRRNLILSSAAAAAVLGLDRRGGVSRTCTRPDGDASRASTGTTSAASRSRRSLTASGRRRTIPTFIKNAVGRRDQGRPGRGRPADRLRVRSPSRRIWSRPADRSC